MVEFQRQFANFQPQRLHVSSTKHVWGSYRERILLENSTIYGPALPMTSWLVDVFGFYHKSFMKVQHSIDDLWRCLLAFDIWSTCGEWTIVRWTSDLYLWGHRAVEHVTNLLLIMYWAWCILLLFDHKGMWNQFQSCERGPPASLGRRMTALSCSETK